jgi:hypothetical protein
MDYEALKAAVMNYFGDTSRSQAQTKEDFKALIMELEMLIEALDGGDE